MGGVAAEGRIGHAFECWEHTQDSDESWKIRVFISLQKVEGDDSSLIASGSFSHQKFVLGSPCVSRGQGTASRKEHTVLVLPKKSLWYICWPGLRFCALLNSR